MFHLAQWGLNNFHENKLELHAYQTSIVVGYIRIKSTGINNFLWIKFLLLSLALHRIVINQYLGKTGGFPHIVSITKIAPLSDARRCIMVFSMNIYRQQWNFSRSETDQLPSFFGFIHTITSFVKGNSQSLPIFSVTERQWIPQQLIFTFKQF